MCEIKKSTSYTWTTCPKQPGCLPKEENHRDVPHPEIKLHLKNV
jgi:hypothetical protein